MKPILSHEGKDYFTEGELRYRLNELHAEFGVGQHISAA